MSLLNALFLKAFAFYVGKSDDRRDRGLREPASVRAYRDVCYAPDAGKEHLLDVYTTAAEGESLPVLVSVHGGGLIYGDKERYRFYCMELALQGYTVVNFNYRLLPARFPAQLEDCNDVMRFIADHAREYHMDAERVYAVGDSMGATILSVYAGILTNGEYAARFSFLPPDLRLCAVALHSGVYDCGGGIRGASRYAVKEWMRGMPEANALLRADTYVSASFPPAFLSYSVNDSLTQDSPAFAAVLNARGVPTELKRYGEGNKKISHVFHLDIRSEQARDCTAGQHEFFRRYSAAVETP